MNGKRRWSVQLDLNEIPTKFKPIDGRKRVLETLQKALDSTSHLMLWRKGQKVAIKSRLRSVDSDFFEVRVPYGFTLSGLKRKFSGEEVYFLVFLKNHAVFGLSSTLARGRNGLFFKTPEKAFRAQRRTERRFQVPLGYELHVNLADPKNLRRRTSRRIIDLSPSGLSFLVDEIEAKLFKKNMILRTMLLKIRHHSIGIHGEVRNVIRLPKESRLKGHKVGVLFRHIQKKDQSLILMFIAEYSIQYWDQ